MVGLITFAELFEGDSGEVLVVVTTGVFGDGDVDVVADVVVDFDVVGVVVVVVVVVDVVEEEDFRSLRSFEFCRFISETTVGSGLETSFFSAGVVDVGLTTISESF